MNSLRERSPSRPSEQPASSEPPAPVVEFARDTVLDGRYQLVRVIGCGGMCVVYEARHLFTGQPAAVKTLLPDFRRSLDARERLLREARLLGTLRHPNIVAVADAALSPDGIPYLVLEKLEGRALDALLQTRTKLGIEESAHVVERVARAIALAHSRGVLHRDIKPSNVVIVRGPSAGSPDEVRLIDFGIAAEAQAAFGAPKLTKQNHVIGTLDYFAPEHLEGAPASEATDVYALGVLLHECLTGEIPLQRDPQRLLRLTTAEAPSVRQLRAEIGEELARVVAKALAREPRARYRSAAELADALASHAADPKLALLRGVPPPLPRQQREHPRAPYQAPVRAWVGTRSVEGRAEDLSTGGMLIALESQVEVGARIDLVFATPLRARTVKMPALVRWVRQRERGSRFGVATGVEFLNVPSDIQDEFKRYVEGTDR